MAEYSSDAASLLSLLEEWVAECDLWERHRLHATDGVYKGSRAEKDVYDDIQRNYTRPLIERCNQEGFKYADLIQIIPPFARTTASQRRRMLAGLWRWAGEEYAI